MGGSVQATDASDSKRQAASPSSTGASDVPANPSVTTDAGRLGSDPGTRLVGVLAILAGVSVPLLIVAGILAPEPGTPIQQLATYEANRSAYAFYAGAGAVFGVFIIAFAAGFSWVMRQSSAGPSTAAGFLVAAGALTQAISVNLFVGTLFAISSAPSNATSSASANYAAAVAPYLFAFLQTLSSAIAGAGLLLFAWAVWNAERFPRWIAYVLLVAGAFGILAFTSFTLFQLGFPILVAVWAFAVGILLLRARSKTAEPASRPGPSSPEG